MKMTLSIPPTMAHLSQDRRGLPIPFVVLVDGAGKPHFQINDSQKVEECLQKGLCAICGQPMPSHDQWLVGGPLSAFHPSGAYIDTPTHYRCLHYALQGCPYLAGKTTRRLDVERVSRGLSGIQALVDPTISPDAVPFFVAVRISGFTIRRPGPTSRYLHPIRPFQYVEYWRNGERITPEQMLPLWNEYARQKGLL